MTSTTTVAKIPTGVPGFDTISNGGIPKGRSTLVVGRAGTGKTILGLQIAAHMAGLGIKTVLVAVEESPEDLVMTGDTLGLKLSEAIKEGRLRVTDASRPMDGPMVVTGDYDISGLTHRIEAIVKQTGAQAIVVDSATALFSPRPPQELLRSLFFQLIHSFKKMGLTSIVLAEAAEDYGQLTTLGVEDYVCDVVVILRNIIDGERRRRSIEINKYRRSPHYKGEYPCTITANGLNIFPLDAKDRPDSEPERYPSGLPGLDGMIEGGLFRDSIVIVRGPTGSGKTTLAGLYARSGAERGERVAYYGFEEPKPILLRNFASLGLPMDDMVASGNLQVHCRYPEAMGLEDLLVGLRLGLEEFKPSLVVLDSISSIEHSSSEKGFRQFMVGLASLLREHGRSALLTQTVVGGESAGHTAPYLSTLADTILILDYSIDKYDLSRTMRVLKMRGSSHVTHPYRLQIGQGGLQVEPQAFKPGATEVGPARAVDRARAARRHARAAGRGLQRRAGDHPDRAAARGRDGHRGGDRGGSPRRRALDAARRHRVRHRAARRGRLLVHPQGARPAGRRGADPRRRADRLGARGGPRARRSPPGSRPTSSSRPIPRRWPAWSRGSARAARAER